MTPRVVAGLWHAVAAATLRPKKRAKKPGYEVGLIVRGQRSCEIYYIVI